MVETWPTLASSNHLFFKYIIIIIIIIIIIVSPEINIFEVLESMLMFHVISIL